MNSFGAYPGQRLGIGVTGGIRLSPVAVTGGHFFVALSHGSTAQGTCGVTATGELWCWGRNNNGQIGDGTQTDRATPVRILIP